MSRRDDWKALGEGSEEAAKGRILDVDDDVDRRGRASRFGAGRVFGIGEEHDAAEPEASRARRSSVMVLLLISGRRLIAMRRLALVLLLLLSATSMKFFTFEAVEKK